MDVKSNFIQEESVDPDDAPELTEELLKHAIFRIGERVVSKEEFLAAADALQGKPQAQQGTSQH